MLLDLGEADVAAVLWNDFDDEELEDDAQAELVGKFGAARFLKLARQGNAGETASGLAGARRFAESCLKASAKVSSDPKRLASLVTDLSNDAAEIRQAARSDLAVVGDAGAIACLEALAQATTPQLRTELMLTLARMRPGVEPMLIAAIADGRGQFRRDVIELAGYLHLQDAVPWLAAIAAGAENEPTVVSAAHAALAKMGLSSPNVTDARAVVLSEIRRLESHEHPPAADAPWLLFDSKQQQLDAHHVSTSEKKLLAIARLTRTLIQLPNATAADRRLALVYAYQISDVLNQPLPNNFQQQANTLSIAELGELLHEALHGNQKTAAIACTKLLGSRADDTALQSIGSQRSSLATALAHTDLDLRFAALETIMAINPQQTFAGASRVSPALWHFATQVDNSKRAVTALGWIADLLDTGHPYDEMLRDAKQISLTLYQPELTEATMRVLAVLGTADSQQLMLDYISTNTLPIESRQAASGAFAKSVRRFGKLLTSQEILRQYDRYNASKTADSDTQEVLGEVLDLLEK